MTPLDNLRKTAKRWLKGLRAGDAEARSRYARAYPNGPAEPGLRDIQHALARERGHESWIALTASLASGAETDPMLKALFRAAADGDAAEVGAILDRHPKLATRRGTLGGHSGLRTALHFGIRHQAVVRTLLERGADPNIRDEGDNAFPLHFAAERGDMAVVKLLVEHGADPIGADTGHELDVLGWAVCFDYATHTEVAHYLLAHGARLTLFPAVAMGDERALRAIAASGVDLNRRMDGTNHRRTALHLAILKKQPRALAALLDAGADPNIQDAAGLAPLDQAALDGAAAMAHVLLERGAEMRLPAAIALGRTEEIERLIRENPDFMSDNRGWARLIVRASARAPRAVVQALLRTAERHRGGLTIVNMVDDQETAVDGASRYTALHAAAFHGNDEAVDVLLAHGADPRVRDGKYCGTPAGWANYAGHTIAAERILAADVDIFDAINFDRADLVARILDGDPGALDRPFKSYADCPSRDDQWWPKPDATPLQWATAQKKQNAVRVLTERGARWTPDQIAHAERVTRFLRFACWDHHVHGVNDHRMYDRAAQRLLAQHPEIARADLYTAIVCGEVAEVERILAGRPAAARERGGSRGWTPLLYLCYTRFTHQKAIDNAIAIARLLLDRGADPNAFYMAGDASYSALVGVAGEGEQDSPRQPYAAGLYRLLLERGAGPYDIQVLYDTHFKGDVLWWLELTYEHAVKAGRASDWRDPDWPMLDMGHFGTGARFLFRIAIEHNDLRLAEWLLSHGANPNAAPGRGKGQSKRSLYEEAVDRGLTDMAALLARHGADTTVRPVGDECAFLAACLRGNRDEARAIADAHPEFLRSPETLFEAARRDRPDALALLLDLGVPLEIEDPVGKTRALHHAAVHGSLHAAAFLIERGAEVDPRDAVYNGTPLGWAAHGDKIEMVEYLSCHSRDVWTLAFHGLVDRLREVLAADPALARQVAPRDGYTPLWWLPDDEAEAMDAVNLLLAAGADPRVSVEGHTAADWARTRGMLDVARRLDAASGAGKAAGEEDAAGFIRAAGVPREGSHASGTLDEASAILAAHPDVAAASIYTASTLGDEAAVRALLALDPSRASVKGGPYEWDALTYLCFSRYLRLDRSRADAFLRTARVLLDAGAGANTGWFEAQHQPEPVWESAIYGAAGVARDAALTRLLLERGADPNDEETPYHVPETYDDSVLHALVDSGRLTAESLAVMLLRKCDWHDYDGIKYLLEHGASPTLATRWQQRTALHHAVLRDNHVAIITLLLDHGADPAIMSDAGTATAMAAQRGRGDLLEEFRRRGFPIELDGADRLVAACATNDRATVKDIARDDAGSVAAVVARGGALLAAFAGTANGAGIAHLLDLGVDVMARAGRGDGFWGLADQTTALHVAAWRAHHGVVRLLLERGADANAVDERGRTPLMLAVQACVDSYWMERRSPESVAALLDAGAATTDIAVPTGYDEIDVLLRAARP